VALSRFFYAIMLLASACHTVLPLDPARKAQDTGPDGMAAIDLSLGDLPTTDVVGIDAPPQCPITLDKDTLALYTFDTAKPAVDSAGTQDGTLQGAGHQLVDSLAGCGKALQLAGAVTNYVEVPHSPVFEVDSGSLDLLVRFDDISATNGQTLVAKDSVGDLPGHLSLFASCGGRIVVRIQGSGSEVYFCSVPVSAGKWYHVGVNFGANGLELWVAGVRASYTGGVTWGESCQFNNVCGGAWTKGIVGNKEPWVFGVGSMTSKAGQPTPTDSPLKGTLDSIRLSSVRRMF
jgi:hypothetical protein